MKDGCPTETNTPENEIRHTQQHEHTTSQYYFVLCLFKLMLQFLWNHTRVQQENWFAAQQLWGVRLRIPEKNEKIKLSRSERSAVARRLLYCIPARKGSSHFS